MQVLAVASEIYPLVKTGGLADVAAALPNALAAEGIETITLVPGYPDVLRALAPADAVVDYPQFYGGPARVRRGSAAGLALFVLDAPHLFARPGNPYLAPGGGDWPDNAIRYAALGRAAADIGLGSAAPFAPQVVHAHDWQAGLTHAFLHYSGRPRPATLMTVHNLAYQGQFPRALLGDLGLPPDSFRIEGVEYYGAIGFLKAGLQFADHITTVSPSYAAEIQGDEGGMGLGGLLRARSTALSGIINGIDTAVWNPETDSRIATTYSASALAGRADNKAALQRRFGLPVAPDALLLGLITRMSWQKGLDLVLANLPLLTAEGMQLALLGSGDHDLETSFRMAADSHREQVGVVLGYDENVAHLIQAGADALLVPSRFEPCGLTQLCALRYGAIPIVSRVGGLADTVVDASAPAITRHAATGIQFWPVSRETLGDAIGRARALFFDKPVWQGVQKNGMAVDVSWRSPARQYADLYRRLARSGR